MKRFHTPGWLTFTLIGLVILALNATWTYYDHRTWSNGLWSAAFWIAVGYTGAKLDRKTNNHNTHEKE